MQEDGTCEPKSREAIFADLDVYQMCLFNFVESELEIDVDVQVEFAKLLFKLDFGSIDAGGFGALVEAPRFAVSGHYT